MFYGTSEFKEIHETSEMLRLLKRNPKLKFKKLDDPNSPETIYELGDQGYLVATDNPTVAIHYHIDDRWELLYPLRGPVTWQEALEEWVRYSQTIGCVIDGNVIRYLGGDNVLEAKIRGTLSRYELTHGKWYIEDHINYCW